MNDRQRYWVGLLGLAIALCGARVSFADNPIIQTKFTADPAPLVYNDTVYLYTSHDEDTASGSGSFTMYNWMLYTSTDMANWTDHGIIGGVRAPNKTFSWAADNGAWAPQVIERGGKFYLYVPIRYSSGANTIAVAVADSPFGPFKDPLGKGLVTTNTSDDIDPTVFIDTDGQAYLYWGNPNCHYVKLNADMISYSGSVGTIAKVQSYQEGPWFYRRGDNYYLAFASTCCPEGIGYAMSANPLGPWTYKNSIMDGTSQSNGNHPGIIDYKGNSYVFGFNYNLQVKRTNTRNNERRSVAVDKFTYNPDGTIPKLPFWSTTGPEQLGTLDPYAQTEAETIASAWDVKTETCGEGGMDVTAIENADFIKVRGADFGAGATSLDVRVAAAGTGGKVEVHLDSQTGKLVGTCTVSTTGGAQTWATQTCPISGATGVHDVYFVFTGGSGSLFNLNWWKFHTDGGSTGGSGGGTGVGGSAGLGGMGGVGGGPGGASSGGRNAELGGAPATSLGGAGTGQGGAPNTGGSNGGGSEALGGSMGGAGQAGGGASSNSAGASSQATSNSDSGCGCSLPRETAGAAWSSWLALMGLAGVLRRARTRRRPEERDSGQ